MADLTTTTPDAIMPVGPLAQHLRGNLPEISKFTFFYEDNTFAQRAAERNGGFIVGAPVVVIFDWRLLSVYYSGALEVHHEKALNYGGSGTAGGKQALGRSKYET